eukprot:179944_1
MASLASLIRFRCLANKLDENEFELFTLKLLSVYGRGIITSSIFNSFTNIQSKYDINEIANIITDIIAKRKKPKNKTTKTLNKSNISKPCNNITKLPHELIGEIASWLKTSSFIQFQATNRIIYISSNTPCTMQSLCFPFDMFEQWFPDHNLSTNEHCRNILKQNYINIRINLNPYKLLKKMDSCTLWQFNQLHKVNPYHIKWNLKELIISNGSNSETELSNFINTHLNKTINCSTITKLTYTQHICDNKHFKWVPLIQFLSYFNNLQYLTVYNLMIRKRNANIDTDYELLHFPYLRGLSLQCGTILEYKLLNSYAHKIEAFQLYGHSPLEFQDRDKLMNFANLKRFQIEIPNPDLINSVLKTAKHLTELHLDGFYEDTKIVKSTISSFIKEKEELKLIYTSGPSKKEELQAVIDGFCDGLNNTKTKKKYQLQIVIELYLDDDIEYFDVKWDDIMLFTKKIMDVLSSCDIMYFSMSWIVMDNDAENVAFMKQNIKNVVARDYRNKYIFKEFIDERLYRMFTLSNTDKLIWPSSHAYDINRVF